MAKPSNTNERNFFKDIDLQIMLCSEQIKNHRRSIKKTKKACGWYGPSGVGGIDYSKERFPTNHISFAEALEMIDRDQKKIAELEEERRELRRSKKRVEKIYSKLTGYEEQVYYHRIILKMTQAASAEKMSLSVRQLQRIESKMKDEGLM